MVLLVVMLPALCGVIGLVLDSGNLMLEGRHVQQVADAAATAAATELRAWDIHPVWQLRRRKTMFK